MKAPSLMLLAMLLATNACATGGAMGADLKPVERGHAPVNGINMYYEVHGRRDGVPLVLLHGGGSTIDVTFGHVLPVFAERRRVIALEEQGHGRTTDRNAPVRFESSADDVAALLRYLSIDTADILGFSNGASVGLQVAIRHPQLVRKLVFASSITTRAGARPELWEFMKQADFSNMPQPLKDAFLRVNPDAGQLRTMHDKDVERMRSFQDVPADILRAVRAPTLIVAGDRDIVTPEHAVELSRLIPGARLLILPGNHGDYLGEAVMTQKPSRYPELTARLIDEFLDGDAAAPDTGRRMPDVQHVSVSIARSPTEVYEFASDPRNLPRWAAGLARSEVRKDGDEWIAEAPFGQVRVRFAARNPFGVMDHDVTLASGAIVHNPMRVVPNGKGSEFVFTLIRQPGMSDEQFARDKTAVERDLKTLKDLLDR
jgi:pimeloyl-ACP methyl ester carboxylesterase